MAEFGVLLIAIDQYPDPPGALPSSESANRLAQIVVGERGGVLINSVVATSHDDVLTAFEQWVSRNNPEPPSTIVYLVGHGTDDGLDHSFIVPSSTGIREVRTTTLASFIEKDWYRRQGDSVSWTLFVLDCCGSDVGVTNLVNVLTTKHVKRPRRLSLWPVTPRGASHSGSFVDAFSREIARFTENDDVIALNELFRRIQSELGDLEPGFYLPQEAALRNPLRSLAPLVMNLDAHAELRRVISGLPEDVRNHFLNKAQGGETGDLTWYFEGRRQETASLCDWLRDAAGGMRVVTGPPGSGKSALLGHLAVLADDELVDAYVTTGLAPNLRKGPRPPAAVFDATIHLTGKILADVVDGVYGQVRTRLISAGGKPILPAAVPNSIRMPANLVEFLREMDRPITVLADALDESQEPVRIANFLRLLARSRVAKVVVGTRRSLSEGPDQPADPGRRELLDALESRDDELMVIENDLDAVRRYVVQRLGAAESPYAGKDRTLQALAGRIAALNEPFLFARLATSELLARPVMAADAPELAMLDGGHAGVFHAAVGRIAAHDPVAAVMLRALALGRGRGLPESGGTWVAVARAIGGGLHIPETAVRTTITAAAPYITLDGEAGQSTYRLAHRTFVEHYEEPFGFDFEPERRAAAALLKLVERGGGWATANYYWVRYLPRHLESAMDLAGLAELTTNPGWLTRAVHLLGVDRTVDSISGGGPSLSPIAGVVQKALRRARIVLSRDPHQLAGQMQARLRNNSDPRLARLGDALAEESREPSLQMRHGALDWQADLETTYGLVGKVRAVTFGRLNDRNLLAIGVDDKIHMWDPLLGSTESRVIDNAGKRVNAIAFARLDRRAVLIVASSYDGQVGVIRDASTGEQIGEPFPLGMYVNSIAAGLLGTRLAIVACGGGAVSAWDAHTREAIESLPTSVGGGVIQAVSEMDGRVVTHVVRTRAQGFGAAVVDVATGADVWSEPMPLNGQLGVMAGYTARDEFIVTGCLDNHIIVTWSPKERRELHRFDARTMFDVPVRALAVTEVDAWTAQKVVALAPDYDSTTLVKLCEIDSAPASGDVGRFRFVSGPAWHGPEIHAVFTLADGTAALLTDSPVAVRKLTSDAADPPLDSNPDQATIAFALTGRRDTNATFTSNASQRSLVRAPDHAKVSMADERAESTTLRVDQPSRWPQTAIAWGQVGDRSVVATGSIGGAVWIWDAESGRPFAGPLTAIPPHVLRMGSGKVKKGAPRPVVTSVALGQHLTEGDIIAVATSGRVRLISIPDGKELPTPTARATVITSVALGRIHDEHVLVTGSQGGVLIVWGIVSPRRIAALTLDKQIDRVWVVHGSNAVAAQAGREVYVLDVVIGSESDSGSIAIRQTV